MCLFVCVFLSGLTLFCDGLSVLGPPGPLTAELLGSVMLPCYVETPIPLEELEVEWKKTGSESLVHLFNYGQIRPESQSQVYSGRAGFFNDEIKHGNFSLLLTDLTELDTGVYSCIVYRGPETGQTSAEIKEIERLIVTGGHLIFAYVGEDITLNCSVNIPPEKLNVSWKKVAPEIPVLSFKEGEVLTGSSDLRYMDRVEFFDPKEIHRGNFSLRLKDLRTEDKGLYICEVFAGDFSANTTVEVQQLGFSSFHIGGLFFCVVALVPLFLSCHAYRSLQRNENGRAALYVHYVLVFFPNIALCLAFILWGITDGFFSEAATCSSLNLLRIGFLFWIAPYLSTFNDKIRTFIERSAISLEYTVITTFAYSGIALPYSHEGLIILSPVVLMSTILVVFSLIIVIQGIYKKNRAKIENTPSLFLISVLFISEILIVAGIFAIYNILKLMSSPGYFFTLFLTLMLPRFLPFFLRGCACQCFYKKNRTQIENILSFYKKNRAQKENTLIFFFMSVGFILEILIASISIYLVYDTLKLIHSPEFGGITCVIAYLYVLTQIILLDFFTNLYGSDSGGSETETPESGSRVMETQRTRGHAMVYMFGAVGLTFVNSVALAVELILKARKGERTVADLRVIIIPFECVFALCCLALQISTIWREYKERLLAAMKGVALFCVCKQAPWI